MQQKDNDQFSFINEKIKEKPVNKKRLLMQAGFIALMAVVFGIIASLTPRRNRWSPFRRIRLR